MADRFGRKHHGVVVHLLQVIGGLLLDATVSAPLAGGGQGQAAMVGAPGVGRQKAAAVRTADLEVGEPVQRTLENQMRQSDRGLDRKADDVGKIAVAFQATRQFGGDAGGLRMNEHQHAQFFHLGPERMEPGIGEFHVVDGGADGGAAQSVLLDTIFELPRRHIGVLQRHRGKGDKAVRVRGAGFRQLLVLDADHFFGHLTLGRVPERIDRQGLHVDGLRVHRGQALVHAGAHVQVDLQRRAIHLESRNGHGFRHRAMRVDVDHPHPLAGDHGRAAPGQRAGDVVVFKVATDKAHASRCVRTCAPGVMVFRAHLCVLSMVLFWSMSSLPQAFCGRSVATLWPPGNHANRRRVVVVHRVVDLRAV